MKKQLQLMIVCLLAITVSVRAQIQVEPDGVGCSASSSLSKFGSNLFYFGKSETSPDSCNLFMHDGVTGTSGISLRTMGPSSATPTSYQIHEGYGKGIFTFNLNGGNSPWVTDGTTAGTFKLSTTANGASWYVNAAGKVFFPSFTSANGSELWMTDGTVAGTQLVKDMRFGSSSSFPTEGTLFNNEVWFLATIVNNTTSYLCKSDGTTAGTTSLTLPSGISGSVTGRLTVLDNYLYFNIGGNTYRTDGTTAGTSLVRSGMTTFNTINNLLLATNANSLFAIDPLTLDTNILRSELKQPSGGWVLNNKLIFAGSTTATGSEPFVTDGTAAGTELLANITLTSYSTTINKNVAYLNNELYFSTQIGVWKTNGTAAGTFSTGITLAAGELNSLTNLNNDIYCIKTSSVIPANKKLWRLAGNTVTGIAETKQVNSLLVYPNPTHGKIHFTSDRILSDIKIYDLTGRIIYSQNLNSLDANIDITNQSAGIYFYHVTDEKSNLTQGKIILQ